jgi:hypothetical protein
MMRLMMPLSFFLLLSTVFFSSSASARYEGRQDNKPVVELELMNDQELFSEMMSVCLSVAFMAPLYGPQFQLDAMRYAQLIEHVSHKQHSGTSPQSMRDLLKAVSDGRQESCERTTKTFIEEKKREQQRKSRNP